ncbi:MAG TPA: hypothetical protein DC047_06630 [Blastocatellia bacterium]|nr:hypothetical protein [Blastocatellia bacterium]
MSKALDWMTTIALSAFFLCCTLAVIAGLDEFARIPFYATLPVAACLINGTAVFLIWRRRSSVEVAGSIFSRVTSGVRAFSGSVTGDRGNPQFHENPLLSIKRPTERFSRTQSREVLAAVAKIHSVAWFPASASNVPPCIQETRVDHEAR